MITLEAYLGVIRWSFDLVWGNISTKLAYLLLMDVVPERSEWWFQISKWKLPPRTVICCWLALENCLFSLDNLIRRGLIGPGIWLLCGQNEESILHLFVSCCLCKYVWKIVGLIINDKSTWSRDSLSSCFCFWPKKYPGWKTLPCFILWELWRCRNLIIF